MGAVKDWILGIAIAIIFPIFIGFGIEAFYDSPQMEKVCGNVTYEILVPSCPPDLMSKPLGPREIPQSCWCDQKCDANGTCYQGGQCRRTNPEYNQCQQDYNTANEKYTRNVFILTSVIGLLTMIIGAFILSHASVAPGLMAGGFITIIYGTVRYWSYAGDKLRFGILGFILAVLIYFAYTKWPGVRKK